MLYNIKTTFFFDTTFKCCNIVMLYYVVFSPTSQKHDFEFFQGKEWR